MILGEFFLLFFFFFFFYIHFHTSHDQNILRQEAAMWRSRPLTEISTTTPNLKMAVRNQNDPLCLAALCNFRCKQDILFITQLLHNLVSIMEKKKILQVLPWQTLPKYQTFSTRSSILIRRDTLVYSWIFAGSPLHRIDSRSMSPTPNRRAPVWNPLNKTLVTEQAR